MSRFLLWLYSLATWAAQPLLRRKLRRRGEAEPGYLLSVDERFGRYGAAPARPQPVDGGPLVWLHAVSLGETRAAAGLVQAMRERWPGMCLLLTHGTATGRAEGLHLMQAGDIQLWQPWDTRAATRSFVRQYRPDLGVLMETEVWPNLVQACRAAQVPLVLANARLSERSLQAARRGGGLMRAAYGGLTAVLAQTEDDAQRLRSLGAPVQAVLGNLKFDAQPPLHLLERGRQWRTRSARPVLMLASAREGEEALLLAALARLPAAEREAVQWLIVPRHPQRFDEVAALVREQGLSLSRRSQWSEGEPAPADVWLGDSLGEMPAYYALAQLALLGGSFAPLGGQNLIEAAACACPVLMGPNTFNFSQAAEQAETCGAAGRVADMATAVQRGLALVQEGGEPLQAMRRAGESFALQHQGAAGRTVQALARLLES